MKYRNILILAAMLTVAGIPGASAQAINYDTWGSSHPSPTQECGEYQWPLVQAPCPEVQIKQKHDHTAMPQYRNGAHPWSNNPNDKGWDTVVDCRHSQLELSCMPYIPVQYFNGYYAVDVIPFDPPDTSFHLAGYPPSCVTKMQINNDDDYAAQPTQLAYPFYFFGIQKTQFRIGDNGIVNFTTTPFTDTHYNGPFCPYSIHTPIPWSSSSSAPGDLIKTNDAIYGVYEDTYTGSSGSYMSGNQGIYYGVIDEYPCRKIIATWNQIPQFGNTTERDSYQMVCYEGSNIIEVHVKDRNCCPSTSDAVIGIQNATGTPQQPVAGTSTRYVRPNAPAAFWPTGKNLLTTEEHNTAYRFTPQGNTNKVYDWFRILNTTHQDTLPNGSVVTVNDTVHLRNVVNNPDAADDSNGYYYPMVPGSSCPTLTRAFVSPHMVSRYVFHLKFQNANSDWYDLYDTIVIGVDTAADLSLHAVDSAADNKCLNICAGSNANLILEYPAMEVDDSTIYRVFRRSLGTDIDLDPGQSLTVGQVNSGFNGHTRNITLRSSLPTTGQMANKIDSVYVQVSVNFTSGCFNYDTMLVCIYPNFDTTVVEGICHLESYVWSANGRTYTTSTYATEQLHSTPGCDSTVHLDLTVYDRSYTIDHVNDCKPYTWINGETYYTSNNATAVGDTILLQNQWGCDSVVQLEFTLLPVVAHIQSDRDFFDFDHLDAVLSDVSENNISRTWVLPGGGTLSGPKAYYTIPAEYDEAEIWLMAHSEYGCVDSTHIVIPMRKETFWMPNIFTPGSANGNNTFGSVSTRTIKEEMYIYNRHGMLVFHCDTPDCQWDGNDLNGTPCPQGTYMYLVRYSNEFLPKVVHVLKGSVTLIR